MHASSALSGDFGSLPPRERILLAARELFYVQGLNAVGVETLAAVALTNKMTLYRHFASKDELIVAYVTGIAKEAEAVWQQLAQAHSNCPDDLIDAWVGHVEQVLATNMKRGCALANAAVELPPSHPARTVIETYKSQKRDRLMKLFVAARYKEPEQLADEIFLLFEGARISLQFGGRIPVSRIIKLLRDLLATSPKLRKSTR